MMDKKSVSVQKKQPIFSWVVVLFSLYSLFFLSFASCSKEPLQEQVTETLNEVVGKEKSQEQIKEKQVEKVDKKESQESTKEKQEAAKEEQVPTKEPNKESTHSEEDAGMVEIDEPQKEVIQEKVAETKVPDGSTGKVTIQLSHASDAIASYLMTGSAWNLFHGKSVPLGRHTNTTHHSYHTALRFRGVNIPKNATITSAKLSFYPQNDIDKSHRLMINIYAERTDNSAEFDPKEYTKGRPDQRLKTKAKIDRWIVRCRDDCSSDTSSPKWEYDCAQRKKDCWTKKTEYQVPKDLKSLIQEVVQQANWKSGNSLSIFLFNAATDRDGAKYKDRRSILGYDSSQSKKAPTLTIHFK